MYTMKIVLFNILLICVVSEISATWSPRTLVKRIGSMKDKLSEEEAKQDILTLLNMDDEDGSKSMSLQNFPLKKLLKADFSQAPMFQNANSVKSKPEETLEVVPLDSQQKIYSDYNGKYQNPKYLTPSQLDDDSESDEMNPNNHHVNSDTSATDEMLFVVRLPPNYYKEQLLNKPYNDNIPPIVDGLSVEDMTVLEIPPESKESQNYYFKPNNKPQFNFYQSQHAGGQYYKPKYSSFKKKLMRLIKKMMFKSRLIKQRHIAKNPYRVGDDFMGKIKKVVKNNSMTYYDKFKVYLQELVAKLLNKAIKQKEDQEKVRRNNHRRRTKRETLAGYTQDPDTCKKYNENLEKMWATLSTYLNSTEPLHEQALHNIAVMVEAYMAHQKERPRLEELDYHQEKKKDKISEVLKKIRKLLGDEKATEKVKEMVLENFKPEYGDNPECKQTNEDNLLSSIDLSYKNYLENSKCRGDYDTGLLRGKALLRNGGPKYMKRKDMLDRQFYETYVIHKSVLDEAETSGEFHKPKLPVNKRYKKRGKFNRRNNKRSFGRSTNFNRYARQSKKRHSGLRRRPKKSTKKRSRPGKTHIRSDEACVKYANQKFLMTLRTSIERFMDLRDCHQDDTLRTSKTKRKAVNPRRKQPLGTMNKRKFNDMTFYTDAELGEKERRRINNYLSNVHDFNDQEFKRNKSIFIVHTTSYKSPLLLKLNNKREGLHSYTSNMKRPLESPNYHNKPSKYSFDTIYKSFIESSDKDSFDTLHSKKSLVGGLQSMHNGGIRDINLYDIIKQKVDEEKNKRPFGSVGRQNDGESALLDVEPIHYDNATDDASSNDTSDTNLPQNGTSINFEEIGNVLDEVRNSTLQKPQIDANNFVSNNDKGYVELSYLVKYPKSIVFRPQYLVKNILQYDEFVKVASQLYVTDEDKQLLKIVRYLADNKTQILFETQDFKSPIEVFDVKEDIKKKPIFSSNFSDSNEALRQRSDALISVMPANKVGVDSPLRENDRVNSLAEDIESTGVIPSNTFTEDIINTDISNIEPLQEMNDITRAEILSEDDIHTDLGDENSLRESNIIADDNHTDLFKADMILNNNNKEETEDVIKSNINIINVLRDSKISLEVDKVDNLKEDEITTDINPVETLPEIKIDTEVLSTDYLRESNKYTNVNHTDLLRNENIDSNDNQTDRLKEEVYAASLRETKQDNKVNFMQEDEKNSKEQNIEEIKINYDVNHTELLREANISTEVNRADIVQEDKINAEDSIAYVQSEDKNSMGLSEIDLLRQKKVNLDTFHVDLLGEDKLNQGDSPDKNEQNLLEGNFKIDFTRIDSSQEDKIITDENHSESVLTTNIEEHNADSLRESNIDIDVDRAHPMNEGNIEANNVRDNAISSEVNRLNPQIGGKNDFEISHGILRDDKIITKVNHEDPLQKDEHSAEDYEYRPNEKQIGIFLNILNSDKKESTVNHGDSTRENSVNTDVNQEKLEKGDIGSTNGHHAEFLLEDAIDTKNYAAHSLRESKISTNTTATDSKLDANINTDVYRVDLASDRVEESKKKNDVSLLRVYNTSTEVNRDNILAEDKINTAADNEEYSHEIKTTSTDFHADSLHETNINNDSHALSEVNTSSEENTAPNLQQIKINHDIDFTDLLREHYNTTGANVLKDDETDKENDTNSLREIKIISTAYPRAQEIISAEVIPEYSMLQEKIDNADSLRANNINPFIKHEDSLGEESIIDENNNGTSLAEHKIDYGDSLRENQISLYDQQENSLQQYNIITEANNTDQVEIRTEVNTVDSLRENKITPYTTHDNNLLKDSVNVGNINADALPKVKVLTKIDYVDSLRENLFIKHENSSQLGFIADSSDDQDKTHTEIDLLKDGTNTEINNAETLSEHKIRTKIDHIDYLRENTDIKHETSLQEDSISNNNNNEEKLRENINNTKIDNADFLRESLISHEVKQDYPLAENKIIQKDNVNSLQDRIISSDVRYKANVLRGDKITTDSKRDDALLENNHSNEFNYAKKILQSEDVDPSQNSETNAEFNSVENFHGASIKSDIISIDLKEKNSKEFEKVDLFKESVNTDDDILREGKVTNQKITDAQRKGNINHDVHGEDPLLEDKHSVEFNSNEYQQSEKESSVRDNLRNSQTITDIKDPLREHNMKSDVSPVELPQNKISIDVSQEHNNIDGNSEDSLSEVKTNKEFNRADLLSADETNARVSQVDPIQDKIISKINHEDTKQEGTSSTDVNSVELLPEDSKTNTDIIDLIENTYEAKIDSDLTRSDYLREDGISTDIDKSDTSPKDRSMPIYNNVNILRVSNVSTGVNREDSLTEVDIHVHDENSTQKDKVISAINKGDPLPEDILKKILRDDEIKFNISNEYSQDKIGIDDKTDINDKTDTDVSNFELENKDNANTEENNENPLPSDKISAEISSVTALEDSTDLNDLDHSDGEEISVDNYLVNPLIKDTIGHEIENSDSSHADLLSDDDINIDINREDTDKINPDTNRVGTLQENLPITDGKEKGFLRESSADTSVKLAADLPKDKNKSDLNLNSLQDQISTNVTRSGPLPEDKIEVDDLNLDTRKEPRNYTDELDYLTYQDGFIAEGLNSSSNEFEREGNLTEPPNPVLNETSYKYNASSALKERVIDAFNDSLNSSEFINKKDDVDLSELDKNISLPDIDAESLADYLRFTLNNAEASLSSASQAYLKELESQGLSNAAATKLMLKQWWDAWKDKLTAKVQSIAGRVTNLFKKLDNTTLSNEESKITDEIVDN